MQVRTVRPHQNAFGGSYSKAKGDTYDHPAPSALIKQGLVEEVRPQRAAPSAAKPVREKTARKVAGNVTAAPSPTSPPASESQA